MEYIIESKALVKSFRSGEGELVVLKGLDFAVKKGEYIAITGRSGSGKSTLLYQLSLLDTPTSGDIFLEGEKVSGLSGEERTALRLFKLGYVFQDYALVPELTALEQVMAPLLMQGLSKEVASGQAAEALTKIGLHDKLENLPSQLSGGQQQRVSIARAIAHNPAILFADEPTANLDADTSQVVLDIFDELHHAGQTIIMVTHEPEYALRTERIVTLSDGVITSEKMTGSH